MNAEQLLAHYERIADAPDAIVRLRRLILDLAVRGKLVPQDPKDEPASELLQRTAKEKARLVKAGEIKHDKPTSNASSNGIGFDLPAGWANTCLADVAVCLDYRRVPINGTERESRIAGKAQQHLFPYYGATQQQGWIDGFLFDGEFVLLGEDGVPFYDPVRTKAYLITGKSWVNNHAHVFQGILTSPRFLVHYLNVFDYTGRVVGATRAKLNQAQAMTIPIGLPPLAEQHRIVAKVDELMALCDRLEAARAEREAMRDRLAAASLARLNAPDPDPATFANHTRFALNTLPGLTTRPDQIKQLRQTILSLAVRGLLVRQVPSNEQPSDRFDEVGGKRTARKRTSNTEFGGGSSAELPFECPATWEWATVQGILDPEREISYGVIKLGSEPKIGGIPTLRCSDVKPGLIDLSGVRKVSEDIENEYARTRLQGGEIVINIRGTLGGVALVPAALRGFNVAREVAVIPVSEHVSAKFYVYLMLSPYFWNSIQENLRGIAYKGLNLGTLREFRVPRPPLTEQHRIVAKVDALMALCDRLEASLTAASVTRRRLLDALLAEALAPIEVLEEKAA